MRAALTPALRAVLILSSVGFFVFVPSRAGAAEVATAAKTASTEQEKMRNFYTVLEDLVSDFEYDLKNGQVSGLRDLSVRGLAVNELVPASFKTHLELVITERLLKAAKVRMIQCLQCRARKTVLSGDQMVISGPETNPNEMSRIARQAGIQNFMDIAFSYQPTGMVLSLYITEADTGSVIWSRSYNSETSRTSAYRRGVDQSQVEGMRSAAEYLPLVQYRVTVFYGYQPNLGSYTGTLGVGFRMMERYDNRKKEVGFEVDYFRNSSGLAGASPVENDLYGGINLTLLFQHAWNLIGEEENYNRARGSIVAGIGGTYASGFLGGLVRGGYEWRLARYWAVSASLGYRPSATKFVGNSEAGTVSGIEATFGVSALF
ncbi:MAG: hypothetical protein ACK5QT_06580 [Oligoflexia bacterium]|jgi:hypothetical protein